LASLGKAWLFERREDYASALDQFDAALKNASLQWQRYEAHSGRARALEKLGRTKDAADAKNDAMRYATEIVMEP
jgi:tetratricopeptide (TPR) repeat protein